RSWISQTHVPVSITTLSFADDRTGWAGGNPAAIYHTTDGGHTWDRQRTELGRGEGIPQVTGVGAKQFQICGLGSTDIANGCEAARSETEKEGRMLGTTNGGKTWAQVWITNVEKLRAVFFVNRLGGWARRGECRLVHPT